jgi:hypothetical protein
MVAIGVMLVLMDQTTVISVNVMQVENVHERVRA